MHTFEDLQRVDESNLPEFVRSAIFNYKSSDQYKDAKTAYEYFCRKNTTIINYQKLLYTLSGEAVPDNFSANYKFCNAFFRIFIMQETSYLLGNGVTFNEDGTKDKLGGDEFDERMIDLAEYAAWGGVAYGFFNLDHLETFNATEFVPLWGEEDGALHAGIRWWQIDELRPLRATLYEEDGYTDYIWYVDAERRGQLTQGEVLHPKRPYKQIVATSPADGEEILDGENYPGFPIVPLWGNMDRQSELTGLREKIDGYDLIQSGFANDLDDASQIYWTIQNAGGMDDIDLRKFIERMKTVKAAVMEDDGARAEAHTMDVPFAARQAALADLRDSLYRDAMALDTDRITAGNVTATAINASYANLDMKCDRLETCVTNFLRAVLELIGVEDSPSYKRNRILNVSEETQLILASAELLDQETMLKHLPFLSPDEIDTIMERKQVEEAERYLDEAAMMEEEEEEELEPEAEEEEEGEEEGEDVDDLISQLESLLEGM